MSITTTSDSGRDGGFVSSVEIVYVGFVALLVVVFLGYLGRLTASGVQATNVAQHAARAASLAPSPDEGVSAARSAVDQSGIGDRCESSPAVDVVVTPGAGDPWFGGSVTVTITCDVAQASLSEVWTPGTRTLVVSDTQPIDRFQG